MYGRNNSQPILLLVIFIALSLIFSFVGYTHWIDLGAVLPATLIFLPVVMAGAILGSGSGALVGLLAGLGRVAMVSLLAPHALITPLFSSFYLTESGDFVFTQSGLLGLATGLVPPIVAGMLAAVIFRKLRLVLWGNAVSLGLAGALGALLCAALQWAGIWAILGGLSQAYIHAALINTGFEVAAAALACALPGALLYHKYGSDFY